ncbi:MAG: hypothetical protein ABIG30_01705 [Candidatus Aenigmatarchaeota archaeon]
MKTQKLFFLVLLSTILLVSGCANNNLKNCTNGTANCTLIGNGLNPSTINDNPATSIIDGATSIATTVGSSSLPSFCPSSDFVELNALITALPAINFRCADLLPDAAIISILNSDAGIGGSYYPVGGVFNARRAYSEVAPRAEASGGYHCVMSIAIYRDIYTETDYDKLTQTQRYTGYIGEIEPHYQVWPVALYCTHKYSHDRGSSTGMTNYIETNKVGKASLQYDYAGKHRVEFVDNSGKYTVVVEVGKDYITEDDAFAVAYEFAEVIHSNIG